jgi:hypothetical protein
MNLFSISTKSKIGDLAPVAVIPYKKLINQKEKKKGDTRYIYLNKEATKPINGDETEDTGLEAYEDVDYVCKNVLFNDPDFIKNIKLLSPDNLEQLKADLMSDDQPVNPSNVYKRCIKVLERIYEKELFIKDDNVFPNLNLDAHQALFITANAGAGKSYYVGQMLRQIRSKEPNRPIYIISKVDYDEAYEGINAKVPDDVKEGSPEYEELTKNNIIRIATKGGDAIEAFVTDKHRTASLKIEDLKNSVVVIDDCNTVVDKGIATGIRKLMDDILETGRHHDIILMATTHMIQDYVYTRKLLSECTAITVFPNCNWPSVVKFFKNNAGLTPNQIEKVKAVSKYSRWLTYNRASVPNYVIHEHGVFVL